MGELVYKVSRDTKLEEFLRKDAGISKRMILRLKRTENGITRNGKLVRTIDMVYKDDLILLKYEDSKILQSNENLSVDIAFQNENLVVFDKPVGMPVHPSIKHQGDTLGNFFAYRFPALTFRPINRLDRDTSGLCIVAKNAISASALQNNIEKIYYAVVMGKMSGSGTINAPIAREKESIIKRVVRSDGQESITHYKTIISGEKYSFLEIKLETGRTHQIRVHFSHIGHPLAGDDLYGGSLDDIGCQALHCGQLIFKEPITGEIITVKSSIREDMKNLIKGA